jgi:hypothetical protein
LIKVGARTSYSCPEMVCPCGLRLSSGTPLPINAGLGFLDRHPVRICEPREFYLQNLQKRFS